MSFHGFVQISVKKHFTRIPSKEVKTVLEPPILSMTVTVFGINHLYLIILILSYKVQNDSFAKHEICRALSMDILTCHLCDT